MHSRVLLYWKSRWIICSLFNLLLCLSTSSSFIVQYIAQWAYCFLYALDLRESQSNCALCGRNAIYIDILIHYVWMLPIERFLFSIDIWLSNQFTQSTNQQKYFEHFPRNIRIFNEWWKLQTKTVTSCHALGLICHWKCAWRLFHQVEFCDRPHPIIHFSQNTIGKLCVQF